MIWRMFKPRAERRAQWIGGQRLACHPQRSGITTQWPGRHLEDGSSVQTDPEGSRRIVWMINRMIKPATCPPHRDGAGSQSVKLGAQGDG
jgi:hypothetical protein